MKTKILVQLACAYLFTIRVDAQSHDQRHYRAYDNGWYEDVYGDATLNKYEKRHLRKEKRQIRRLKKHMLRDGRLDARERHLLRKLKRQHRQHAKLHRNIRDNHRHCR
jgi:hypothetical protein